jgi:hypothetical protein
LLLKKFVRWDRYKCLKLKKEICDQNKFEIFSEELGNGELYTDSIVELLINTSNSIIMDLSITSSTEIRKEKRCLECPPQYLLSSKGKTY